MSEKQRKTPSPGMQASRGDAIDVGAVGGNPITGRAGAIVMRTVSIFLTSGRRVSVNHSKQRQQSGASGQNPSGTAGRRRRRIPDDGNMKTSTHHARIIDFLKKKTRFTRMELEALCKIYQKLTTNPGPKTGSISYGPSGTQPTQKIEGIDRTIFRELLHNTFDVITEDTLVERMFCCWDRESEGAIRLESWILGLDVFLRGNLRDKIEFCFRVYDLNNDGYITKDEMFILFKNCLIRQPGEEDPDEGVRDLSELALKKLDEDHDGKVSFQDYETAIKKEPLLLEAFGQCLPAEESCQAFIITLQPLI